MYPPSPGPYTPPRRRMQYPEQPKNKVPIVVLRLLLVLGAAVLAGAGYVAYKAAGASQRASSPTTGKADTKEPASGSTDPAPGNYQLKRNDKVAFLLQGMYKSCAQGESWLQLVDGPAGPRTLHFLPTEPPKGTEKEVSLLCMWKDLGLPKESFAKVTNSEDKEKHMIVQGGVMLTWQWTESKDFIATLYDSRDYGTSD